MGVSQNMAYIEALMLERTLRALGSWFLNAQWTAAVLGVQNKVLGHDMVGTSGKPTCLQRGFRRSHCQNFLYKAR